MSLLPSAVTCCDPCDEPVSVAVPGPAGDDGSAGAAGADGVSAFTTTTADFNMPAELANVTISVVTSAPFVVGQVVVVQVGGAFGYFEVAAVPGATSLQLTNLEDASTSAYASNSAPGTVFASGAKVTPGGLQGPDGVAASAAPNDATYIVQTPSASLTSEQALSALASGILYSTTATGVVSIATAGTDYYAPGSTDVAVADGGTGASNAAGARTNLGLAIGTNVQAYDATLQSLSSLGTAADKIAYTTGVDTWAEADITALGRSILADVTPAQVRADIDADSGYGLLAALQTVDVNAGPADNAMTVGSTRYRIDKVTIFNASISLTTATCGVFTAAGGAGTTIAADQAMSALTASGKFDDLTLEAVTGTDAFTSGTLYFRIGTPQGAAATCDVRIFGWMLD